MHTTWLTLYFVNVPIRYDGEGQSAYLDSFSGSSLGNSENSSAGSTPTKNLAEVKSENLGAGEKVQGNTASKNEHKIGLHELTYDL
jgi:hypothetical protein